MELVSWFPVITFYSKPFVVLLFAKAVYLCKVTLLLKFPLSTTVLFLGLPRAYSKLMQVPHDSILQ